MAPWIRDCEDEVSGKRRAQSVERKKSKNKKRPLIFGTVAVLFCYVFFSIFVWVRMDSNAQTWAAESKTTIDGAAKEIRNPAADEPTQFDVAREALSTITADAQTACKPNLLIRWQGGLFKDNVSKCEVISQNVESTSVALDAIASYLIDETQAAAILDSMAQGDNTLDEKKWDEAVANWKKVEEEITALNVSEAFEPTKDELLVKVGEIQKSWDELISSHEKKNLAAFAEAKEDLKSAHNDLGKISEKSSKRLADLDQNFIDAYEKAFGSN